MFFDFFNLRKVKKFIQIDLNKIDLNKKTIDFLLIKTCIRPLRITSLTIRKNSI